MHGAHIPYKTAPKPVVFLVLQFFAAPDVPLVHVTDRRVTSVPAGAAVRRAAVVWDRRIGEPLNDVGKDLLVYNPRRERVDAFHTAGPVSVVSNFSGKNTHHPTGALAGSPRCFRRSRQSKGGGAGA